MKIKNIITNDYKEILKYILAGIATTFINWLVYILYQIIIGFSNNWSISLANAFAWILAVVFAFFINKIYVFNSKSFSFKLVFYELIKFIGSRIISGLFEIVLPVIFIYYGLNKTFLGIEYGFSKVFASIFVIAVNYILSKKIVFNIKSD